MFSVQARASEVKLELLVSGHPATSTGTVVGSRRWSMNTPHLQITQSDGVWVDKFKIDQVLRNLVSNALKFSPKGSTITLDASFVPEKRLSRGAGKITTLPSTTEAKRPNRDGDGKSRSLMDRWKGFINMVMGPPNTNPDPAQISTMKDYENDVQKAASLGKVIQSGRLVVKVTDQGAGISEANQKRLFKEVIQFNPEKLQAGGGSGFGLFITKGIVDLHQGQISVFSEGEEKGCTFTINIPMNRFVDPPSNALPNSRRIASSFRRSSHDIFQSVFSSKKVNRKLSVIAVNVELNNSNISSVDAEVLNFNVSGEEKTNLTGRNSLPLRTDVSGGGAIPTLLMSNSVVGEESSLVVSMKPFESPRGVGETMLRHLSRMEYNNQIPGEV